MTYTYEELVLISAVKKKSGKRIAVISAIAAGGALVVLTAATALWGLGLKLSDTIFPNVTVAGVNIGGMTADEAKTAVERSVAEKYSRPMEIVLPDGTVILEPEQVNASLDAGSTVEKALSFGRDTNVFSAVLTRLKAGKSPTEISLEQALDMDTAYIRQTLQAAASEAMIPAIQPKITQDNDTGTLTVTMGTDGRMLDLQSLYNAVITALQDGDLSPLSWDYSVQLCSVPDLDALYENLHVDPVDAYYDSEARQIVDGVPGISFDLDGARETLLAAQPGENFVITLEEVQPEVTTESLTAEMFGDMLASKSGPYQAYLTNRTNNLVLACEAINGTILNPGDVFSFNEVVGERTKERGYLPATVYVSDSETAPDYGGGVCQVASVIYYTTLHLDVKQVERHPHVFTVTYVPYGMDAGIYWSGNQDYKFENTLSHPIKLQAVADGSKVIITVWGVKENDNYVEMTYQVLSTSQPEVVEVLDESKPYGYREKTENPQSGCSVVAIRTSYDGDGNVLDTSKVYSTYKKKDERWVVGPGGGTLTEAEEEFYPDTGFDPEVDDPLVG